MNAAAAGSKSWASATGSPPSPFPCDQDRAVIEPGRRMTPDRHGQRRGERRVDASGRVVDLGRREWATGDVLAAGDQHGAVRKQCCAVPAAGLAQVRHRCPGRSRLLRPERRSEAECGRQKPRSDTERACVQGDGPRLLVGALGARLRGAVPPRHGEGVRAPATRPSCSPRSRGRWGGWSGRASGRSSPGRRRPWSP